MGGWVGEVFLYLLTVVTFPVNENLANFDSFATCAQGIFHALTTAEFQEHLGGTDTHTHRYSAFFYQPKKEGKIDLKQRKNTLRNLSSK